MPHTQRLNPFESGQFSISFPNDKRPRECTVLIPLNQGNSVFPNGMNDALWALVLIPLNQGNSVFRIQWVKCRSQVRLNPFESGQFSISRGNGEAVIVCVLIPLNQGNSVFRETFYEFVDGWSLNPFESGQFSISRQGQRVGNLLRS